MTTLVHFHLGIGYFLETRCCVNFFCKTACNLRKISNFFYIFSAKNILCKMYNIGQVAIGVAALAGLAIAKEKIAIAEISRRNRG
jgi:hypothetical protein